MQPARSGPSLVGCSFWSISRLVRGQIETECLSSKSYRRSIVGKRRLSNSLPLRSSEQVPLFPPPSAALGEPCKPFFVTTPIFYVNASPHIGHLHSLVLTDVLARYSRLRYPGRDVVFSTGTDEHGLKIQHAAKAAAMPEGDFCAQVSQRFKALAGIANISYTDYIRTSETRHHAAAEHFWNRLVQAGDVYKSTHSGWYSISDECFFTAQQVSQREGTMVSNETGNEVSWEEESNWKFRLTKYRDRLLNWADARKHAVHPETMRRHVVDSIQHSEDLSVSRPRSRVQWGVPVPGDPEQTMYVWVDALVNYLTVLGYPGSTSGWPADIHVVGKDIVRFHAVHWPALLMSAGLEPPTRVLAHAHWTMGRLKMSKSKGNVADPLQAMDRYSADAVRWYLMRVGGALPEDADYSDNQLDSNYTLLMAHFGNLLARMCSPKLVRKIQSGSLRPVVDMDRTIKVARQAYESSMANLDISAACEAIISITDAANKFFTDSEPWKLKDSTQPMLYAYSALRIAGILVQPIMPTKAGQLLDRLGIPDAERKWEDTLWPTGVEGEKVLGRLGGSAVFENEGHLFPKLETPA